jgi:CRISPR/Cas system type I-B associated protein Csh2 (Cas7 group RAMP superfamily)
MPLRCCKNVALKRRIRKYLQEMGVFPPFFEDQDAAGLSIPIAIRA